MGLHSVCKMKHTHIETSWTSDRVVGCCGRVQMSLNVLLHLDLQLCSIDLFTFPISLCQSSRFILFLYVLSAVVSPVMPQAAAIGGNHGSTAYQTWSCLMCCKPCQGSIMNLH